MGAAVRAESLGGVLVGGKRKVTRIGCRRRGKVRIRWDEERAVHT